MTKDELVQVILRNAERDRSVLEKYQNTISNVKVEGVEADDPDLRVMMAEKVARIADSLNQCQHQLVELVKVMSKEKIFGSRPKDKPESSSENVRNNVYNEIEGTVGEDGEEGEEPTLDPPEG